MKFIICTLLILLIISSVVGIMSRDELLIRRDPEKLKAWEDMNAQMKKRNEALNRIQQCYKSHSLQVDAFFENLEQQFLHVKYDDVLEFSFAEMEPSCIAYICDVMLHKNYLFRYDAQEKKFTTSLSYWYQ